MFCSPSGKLVKRPDNAVIANAYTIALIHAERIILTKNASWENMACDDSDVN